jgi:hypothetical protein
VFDGVFGNPAGSAGGVKGRRVRTLATDVFVSGAGSVAWDGRMDDGEATPSGIYFARVATDAGDVGMRKIVRLR